MAKQDKAKKERQKARFAVMEAMKPSGGFPVPPRKAMSQAKKASKKITYPISPYPGVGPIQLARWVRYEWWQLGRWQRLALPVIILVGLLTWEKEMELQDARWDEIDKSDVKELAARTYGAYGSAAPKRKLLGIIPLPGGKNS